MTDRLTSEQIDKSCDSITGMLNLMCSRAGYTLDANTQMDISLLRAQAKLAAQSPPVAALPEPRELIDHLDLHVTEHDNHHAGLALRFAWPAVKDYIDALRAVASGLGAQLADVDAAIGNASAFDECKTRFEKIRYAMSEAAKVVPLEAAKRLAASAVADLRQELFIQTESAKQLGRICADKDADRIFFMDKLAADEERTQTGSAG